MKNTVTGIRGWRDTEHIGATLSEEDAIRKLEQSSIHLYTVSLPFTLSAF